MATIDVRDLSKSFGDFVAVRNSSFTVEDGQFVCLLGPSGCGKTTTLRMIAGLELPTSGSISLAGEDVTFKRASERDIAFVFQLFALYPHMNVRRNIEYPLRNIGMPTGRHRRRGRRSGRGSCASSTSSTAPSPASPRATGSGWRSAARSCASPRPS